MTMFTFSCPSCGQSLDIPLSEQGKHTVCPLCSNTIIVPRRDNFVYGAPPVAHQAVPKAITVFGVLYCIIFGLGVIGLPAEIGQLIGKVEAVGFLSLSGIYFVLMFAVNLTLNILLLPLAILLFKRKWNAPDLNILYAQVVIGVVVINACVSFTMIFSGTFEKILGMYHDPDWQIYTLIVWLLTIPIGLVFPGLMIYFLNRPQVRAACNR